MFIAILQARSSSTRLPNKVLKPILGTPMLLLQIERLKRCRHIDKLVIATSNQPDDDALEQLCKEHDLECFRGSLNDVLDRFYQASKAYNATNIIRLTGDCPLADPDVIDHVIAMHKSLGTDYTSNTISPSYPDGLDVEVFTRESLNKAWKEARKPSEHEHVTPYIIKNPDLFTLHNVQNSSDLSDMRWTVDNPEDFAFVTKIYEALYPTNAEFTTQDILVYLRQNPDLCRINSHLVRNAGYQASLEKDKDSNI